MTDNKIQAVIVDDKASARETLKSLIGLHCPQVNIAGEADSVESGQALIRQLNPELVFLDVEMPPGTGFDLVNGLDTIPSIIFTTAHDKYALSAIKISALDYLLKPIHHEDLIQAVAKFQRKTIQVPQQVWDVLRQQLDTKKEHAERLVIPSLQGFEIIRVSDIQYCEADRNYTTFYITGRDPLIVSKTLKEYEALLPSSHFIRVHPKHIVNIAFVKRYVKGSGGSLIMANGKSIEVSKSKKQALIDALG